MAVAAGYTYSLALRTDGTVVVWGESSSEQTAIAASLTNVVAISAISSHNLALKADGTVASWGWNGWGQTDIPDGLSNVVAVAAGGGHSLVLKADGTVLGWGLNQSGQTTAPTGLSDVVAIAAGDSHSLALSRIASVAVSPATGQYSDTTMLEATATPSGSGRLSFIVNRKLAGPFGSASDDATSQAYSIDLAAGEYPIAARFSPLRTTTIYSGESTLTVSPEDATITADPANPTLMVLDLGDTAVDVTLNAHVEEEDDGCPGDLTKAGPVTCTLTPAGGGSDITATSIVDADGKASCSFSGLPIGEYTVVFTIDSDYYVADPSRTTNFAVAEPAPAYALTVAPAAAQYSDTARLAATVAPAAPGSLSFLVSNSASGLLGSPRYNSASGAGSQGYRVWLPAGEYSIAASFMPEAAEPVSGEATLTVTPEARVTVSAEDSRVAGSSDAIGIADQFDLTRLQRGEVDLCATMPLRGN